MVGIKSNRPNNVKLSIIVAFYDCQSSLKDCLESISRQINDKVEIIVSSCCTLDYSSLPSKNDFAITFIEFPVKTILPVLLSAGIASSKGEIIAVTDSSCIVAEDWVEYILKSHQTVSPVIGGSVEILDTGENLTSWASYFCDYGRFMLPGRRGATDAIPGNNFSMKRHILSTGSELIENQFWKTHWCLTLQSKGIELVSEPSVLVRWQKNYKTIPFLINRFHNGRCFAGMRVVENLVITRVFYALGSVLLPVVALFRIVVPVVRSRRFLWKLLLSLPLISLATASWSVGEMIGYIAGSGESCDCI